eukprot:g1170.t1
MSAMLACSVQAGDTVLSMPADIGGHVSHRADGGAGMLGLEVHEIPIDRSRFSIEIDDLRALATAVKPKVILLGTSLPMFPVDVAAVREVADECGSFVVYDGAHASGLIAGGEFQAPLAEGAHLMSSSSYKGFGGPAGGFVLTNEESLAQKLEDVIFPGLTANTNNGKTAALCIAACDLLDHGSEYAQSCIANAQALGAALVANGVPVLTQADAAAPECYTRSHLLAMLAGGHGGGENAALLLSEARIIASAIGVPVAEPSIAADVHAGAAAGAHAEAQAGASRAEPAYHSESGGVRLGLQELTRRGAGEADMPELAHLIGRALHEIELMQGGGAGAGVEALQRVGTDVAAFRRRFDGELRFVTHKR